MLQIFQLSPSSKYLSTLAKLWTALKSGVSLENESFHFALSKNPQIILFGLGLGVHKDTKMQTTCSTIVLLHSISRFFFSVFFFFAFFLFCCCCCCFFYSGVAIALAVIISKSFNCFNSDTRDMFQNVQRMRQSCWRWCFCWWYANLRPFYRPFYNLFCLFAYLFSFSSQLISRSTKHDSLDAASFSRTLVEELLCVFTLDKLAKSKPNS